MTSDIIQFSDRELADKLPWAIILLDNFKKIIWWNLAAEKLFALSSAETISSDIAKVLKSIDLKNAPIELALSSNPLLHVSLSVVPYLNNHYLLLGQDVTHVYHLERMRQDFVADVSHELRTPLTVILGYLETLSENPEVDKSWQAIFAQMHQQSLRMEKLIEDLLLLSRLENDVPENERYKPVAVAMLLENICRDASVLSGGRCHNIHLNADKKLKIYGLENELLSAFSNLIYNAVNYTPANGNIFVDWQRDADFAYMKVCDSGIGISPEHIPRITERFYRVDRARSRESGGTGLGLAIVKHALIRHKGQLKIESELTQGSTFTCIFPRIVIV